MSHTPEQPSIDALLAHADWVRQLARTVVAGADSAEDIAQDAWATALRAGPEQATNLRGWLTRVVQNLARQQRRSAGRRQRREQRIANREPLPTPAELVERADLHRHVVRHVVALPEPGRSTVLLHYFEGLPLRAIAERQGQPLETVRSRLKRALARLRQAFDEDKDGARAVRALAAPLGSPLASGFLMTAKAKFVAAMVAVCAVGAGVVHFVGSSRFDHSPSETEQASTARSQADAFDRPPSSERPGSRTEIPAVQAADRVRDRHRADPEAVANERLLHGRLVGLTANRAWSTPLRIGTGGADHPERTVAVAADGTFSVDVRPWLGGPGGVELIAEDPLYLRLRRTLRPGVVERSSVDAPIEVAVTPACVLRGRVVSHAAAPVEGAPVSLHVIRDGKPHSEPIDVTTSDTMGGYRVRAPLGAACLIVALPPAADESRSSSAGAARDTWLPAATRAAATLGANEAVADTALRPGHPISGLVRRADGTPVERARVRAVLDNSVVTLHVPQADVRWWPGDELWFDDAYTETAADGTFCFSNLTARECIVAVDFWMNRTICDSQSLVRKLVAPAHGIEFELPGANVDVHIEHAGNPLPEATITLAAGARELHEEIRDGRANLVLAPGRPYRVTVNAPGYLPETLEITPPAGRTAHTLALRRAPGARVELTLRGVEGVATARFHWRRLDPSGLEPMEFELTNERGVFVFANVPPGRYRVDVQRPRAPAQRLQCRFADSTIELDVPYSGRIQRDVAIEPGGRLRIRATTPTGAFLRGRCELRDAGGALLPVRFQIGGSGGYVRSNLGRIEPRGVNEADRLLRPGTYDLRLFLDGCDPHRESVTIVPGGIAEIAVVATPR